MSQYSDWYARQMADIAKGERIQEQELKEARESRLLATAQLQADLDQKKYNLDQKKFLLEQQKALAQKEKETRDLEKEVAASQVVNFIESMNPSDRDFPQKLRNLSITNSQIRGVLSDPVIGKYLKENYIKPAEEAHWNAWRPLQEMANEAGAVVDVRKIAPIKDDGTPDGEAFLNQVKPMQEAMNRARQKAQAEELARQQALVARAVKTPGIESVEKTAGGEFVIKSGYNPEEKEQMKLREKMTQKPSAEDSKKQFKETYGIDPSVLTAPNKIPKKGEVGAIRGDYVNGEFTESESGSLYQVIDASKGMSKKIIRDIPAEKFLQYKDTSQDQGKSQILTAPPLIELSSPIGVTSPAKEMGGEVSLPVESVPATTEEPKRKSLGEIF